MSTITFNCSDCKQTLRVSADKAGKKVKCPKCGATLPIPEAEEQTERIKPAPPPAARPAPPPVPREVPDDEARPAGRRPRAADDDDDDDRPSRPPRARDFDDDDHRPRRPQRSQRSRDLDDEDDRPSRYQDRDDYDDGPRPQRTASGAVTLVGILNLVFATLTIAVSVGLMFGGPAIMAMLTGVADDALANIPPNHPVDQKFIQQQKEMVRGAAALGSMVFILAGSCTLILGGVPLVLAGIGVLKRRQWGRILTLILGGLTLLSAIYLVVNGWPLNRNGWITFSVQFAYGAIVFIILLMPSYAEEFAGERVQRR